MSNDPPDEVARLVAAINEHPDPAHGDLTPAGDALVRIGLPALPHVLPLLQSTDPFTRLRAQRVLERATLAWVKQRVPSLPLTRRADFAWRELWERNGAYDWQADSAARDASIVRWRQWLQTAVPW